MVPRKVLTRSGLMSLNIARQSNLNAVCCCCSRQVNTARPKAVVNDVKKNQDNVVKASACWVWRPIKPNNASITLKRYDYGNLETKFGDLVRLNSPEDKEGKPSYSNLQRPNDFKGVPHPLSGDYTPKPQEEIDDSLSVQLNAGRPKFNSVRPNISSDRPKVNTVSPKVNSVRPRQPAPHKTSNSLSPKRPQMNQINQRRDFLTSYSSEHPLKNIVDRGIFDSEDASDTLSVLGKFDRKSDVGFLVGYSLNSKAYRVYNLVTKRVEVYLHVNFLEENPNVKGVGYRWMFNIDYHTDSMNYIPVSLENQANNTGISEETNSVGTSQTPESIASKEKDEEVELIVVPSAVKIPEEKDESRTSSTNL
ncbi:hypothetical protein Tco_0791043 [Tanacetum coccineum]